MEGNKMSDTPETDEYAKADWWTLFRATDHARILERERDEAREHLIQITEYGTEEINAAVELRQKLASALVERDEARESSEAFSELAWKLEGERNQARKSLDEETKFHHRTHSELIQTQCKLMDVTQAIIATLEENRHLADGDDCTLAKLKSVVPDWK
jgi:hypothetical protein